MNVCYSVFLSFSCAAVCCGNVLLCWEGDGGGRKGMKREACFFFYFFFSTLLPCYFAFLFWEDNDKRRIGMGER